MKYTKEALLWIVSILKKYNVPYQITGGFAAKLYGSKRKLADIDIQIPEKDFEKILPYVQNYIKFNPARIKGKNWDAFYMKLEYKNQVIEFDGAYNTKIFDRKTRKWIRIRSDFSKAQKTRVYGILVNVISKEKLLEFKKILSRKVDKIDIKALEKDI